MNGRTYDTRLGRFMQADIAVQSPFDTQSYNRYSYLTNNPLNGTDPSGYFGLKGLGAISALIDPVGTMTTAGATSIAYQTFKQVPYEVGQAANAVFSLACNAWYAACYAAGTSVNAYAHDASLGDSVRAGAVAGASSWLFSPAGGPTPTDVGVQVAITTISAANPEVGQTLSLLYGSWGEPGNFLQNLAGNSLQYGASYALGEWAADHGMTLQELNLILALNSKLGIELAGTTFDSDGKSLTGFTTREGGVFGDWNGEIGVIWDVNDTLLIAQGLPDAVTMQVIASGQAGHMTGHSLGAARVNLLLRMGMISSGTTFSLPVFAYPATGSNGACISSDPICGFSVFSWLRPNTRVLDAPENLFRSHNMIEYQSQWP